MLKMWKRGKVMIALSLIVCLTILAGCGSSKTSGSGAKELKIGVLEPQTGPLAESGGWVINGLKLAEKDVNEKGGVEIGGTKYQVKLVYVDTASTANGALAGFQKLVDQEKVAVILGTMATDETAAIMPQAEKKKIPVLSSIAAGDVLTSQGWKYFFRGGAYSTQGLKIGINTVANELKAKKIAMLVSNDSWGKGYENIWPPALKKANVELLGIEKYELDQRDYSAVLNRIKAMKPDVLVLGARGEHAVPIFTQANQIMPDIKLYELGGSIPEDLVKALGSQVTEGLIVLSRNGPEGQNVQEFKAKYQAAYKKESNSWNYSAYDSLWLMLNGMKAAGTVTDGEKIREALLKTNYDGLVGNYSFKENGDNNLRGAIAYVHDGKVTRIFEDQGLPDFLLKK